MNKLFLAFVVLATSTAACSTDVSGTSVDEDTGGDETLADSTTNETGNETDPDTGMVVDDTGTTPMDTGTATETSTTDSSPDVILPVDTSILADTATADTATADTATADTFVADTFVADTAPGDAGSDTRTDALTDVFPDVPVMCSSVTCTLDVTCTAVGCGSCNMGSGKCKM